LEPFFANVRLKSTSVGSWKNTPKGGNLMKAKAMVAVEPGRMELKEFEVVSPQKDQILLKLGVTSVCASDPKILWEIGRAHV
jgi:hypothetical protein